MDFDLSRIDYANVGTTYPNTLKMLPPIGEKTLQKIVIGDQCGVLQMFSVKNEEVIVQYKSLPGKEITSLQLSGADGTSADKIFVASGNEVKGYNRKGKLFVTLDTSITDTITSMVIKGNDVILSSGNIIVHYRDLKEMYSYLCEDRVISIAVLMSQNSSKVKILAALALKHLVLLENGDIVNRMLVTSGPTCLVTPAGSKKKDLVLYGAKNGSIGLIILNSNNFEQRTFIEGQGLGAVSCLDCWSHAASSTDYLLIGRHDGSVQVFVLDLENFPEKPKIKFSYFCGETVTSIAAGCFASTDVNEIIISTYSGRIFGLRPKDEVPESQTAVAIRLAKLETEVVKLEKQVLNEREKYQKLTNSLSDSTISAPPIISIDDTLSGMNLDGFQELSINSAVPVDLLLVYCERNLIVQTDGAAVVNRCPSDECLIILRCQSGTLQLKVKIKLETPLRIPTSMSVYILPQGAPRVARVRSYSLVCLPEYSIETEVIHSDELLCELKVTGPFSLAEMRSWLALILPSELPRAMTTLKIERIHVLMKTALVCECKRGKAVFKSDDISTLAVIKTVLTDFAVSRNIKLDMATEIPDDYLIRYFKSVETILDAEAMKYRVNKFKNAIGKLDLELKSDTESQICNDYKQFISSATNDDSLMSVIDMVTSCYKDYCSFALIEYNNDVTQVISDALTQYRLEDVYKIFENCYKISI